jgi:hypothetical protein
MTDSSSAAASYTFCFIVLPMLTSISRLMIRQDNYPKQRFARSVGLNGPEKALKDLECMSKAADSISHGDLVDRMIHGSVLLLLLPIIRILCMNCSSILTSMLLSSLSPLCRTDQQWSLLPVHGVLSTVRPAYFTYGPGGGHGGQYGMTFPAYVFSLPALIPCSCFLYVSCSELVSDFLFR